ncbi:MAG: hypothetical protein QNJ72_23625 [Pleurocapsa sp. MO_226.B13]|nr:hypothetical protein [Pleurocapsa sp. MO_226.B13]
MKFRTNQKQDIKDYYQSYGYVVIKQALSASKVDKLLDLVEEKKHHKFFIFNSQDTHVPNVASVKTYLRFFANAVRGRGPEMVMRRENYEEGTQG